MNKVLYLSYDGLTDPLGQSQVLPYITGLSKLGYQFTIISFEKPDAYVANEKIVKDICTEHHIQWMPLWYTKKPPVLSTLKDLYRLRKKVTDLHKKEGFSIIHCRSYLTTLIGLWAKKKWDIKFIFDMRGFWADERIDGGIWDIKNPVYKTIYRFFKQKEQQFFQESDYIISLTHNAKQEIESNLSDGKNIAPIEVIPCCVDLHLFNGKNIDNTDIAQKKDQLDISIHTKVLSYVGSVGTWYMLKEMLLFFKEWLLQYPDSIFLFITGDAPAEIMSQAAALKIPVEKIRIVKGKRKEMPLLISCCDYSLFFIKPLYSKKASSPTKQGEIMAMGKPVICNAHIGDTDQIVEQYSAGVVVNAFSEDSFRNKIQALKSKTFHPDEIRKGAELFYALENGVAKYNQVYQKLISK